MVEQREDGLWYVEGGDRGYKTRGQARLVELIRGQRPKPVPKKAARKRASKKATKPTEDTDD